MLKYFQFECVIWSPIISFPFNYCLLYVVSSHLLKNPGTGSWPFPVLLEYWSSHLGKKSSLTVVALQSTVET